MSQQLVNLLFNHQFCLSNFNSYSSSLFIDIIVIFEQNIFFFFKRKVISHHLAWKAINIQTRQLISVNWEPYACTWSYSDGNSTVNFDNAEKAILSSPIFTFEKSHFAFISSLARSCQHVIQSASPLRLNIFFISGANGAHSVQRDSTSAAF